jgi:predicted metal-dependent hydrolase
MVPQTSRRDLDSEFRRGIELFNRGEFYECHEVLEDIWRPATGADRFFLQSVIHFAVGFYHHQQNNPTGARLQLDKALRKLAGYLPAYRDVDTAKLYREGQASLKTIAAGSRIEGFPRI